MSLFNVTWLPKLEQVLIWCLCVFGLILRPNTRGICLLLCSISANQNVCNKKDENQEVNNKPLKKAAACCCQVTGFLCWLHFHAHVMNRASVFCASFRFPTHAGLQHKHPANIHSFNTHTRVFFLKQQSLQEVVTKQILVNGLATLKVTVKNCKTIVRYDYNVYL